jgi:hypothetical protein
MESTSNASQLTHNERIQSAIADLESQEHANFGKTAKKWGVDRTTLRRRFNGKQRSHQQFHSQAKQCLSDAQEEALIGQINRLSERGIPPTSRIARNLAEEIVGRSVGKNWHTDFIRRHKERLKSLYMRNIDSKRKKAEYEPSFRLFYELESNHFTS